MSYFITFACYGAHLHGDESGSVDRYHNLFGSRLAEANPERVAVKRQQMDQAPYWLDRDRRAIVPGALREFCLHRSWNLWTVHVRTNHVHAVVEAAVRPEMVMNALKSYASRGLNQANLWKFTWRTCCNVPLLYSRGSVGLPASRSRRTPVVRSGRVKRAAEIRDPLLRFTKFLLASLRRQVLGRTASC